MRQTVGLFGGAYKPFHAGHYAAVQKIADETDRVILFVSNKDRAKKGEFPLLWDNMQKVWDQYLIPTLPKNVEVIFTSNPVTAIYKVLEEANENLDDHNTYYIYASIEDLQKRFSEDKLQKYFSRLHDEDQVEGRETGTRGITSGTEMRRHLQAGDVESFTAGLPGPVQRYGQEIFDILNDVPGED